MGRCSPLLKGGPGSVGFNRCSFMPRTKVDRRFTPLGARGSEARAQGASIFGAETTLLNDGVGDR